MNSCEKHIEQSQGKTLVRCFKYKSSPWHRQLTSLYKKWSFPLKIAPVIVTKSAVSCGFGHIYWRNPKWKTSFFVHYMHWMQSNIVCSPLNPRRFNRHSVCALQATKPNVFYIYVLSLLKQLFCLIKHLI